MGEVFAGRYEFVEPIAHGGMGTVWIVWDIRDRVHRAAKLLRQADAGSLIRFVREQSVRIDHDHLVTPRGWSAEDDRVLFTMDLVRGGSVHDLLGDYGALPAAWSATLFDQLLLALEAVHGAGLVHRDVKPANLLLEPTGAGRPHLRLGDFGVAVALNEPRLTQAATVLGTPGYRAPEQMAGADPHPTQDIWAAGIVLAEMLTGRRPPLDAAALPPTPPPGVDRTLWQLACVMAEPDPERRPPSAAEVRGVLATTGLVAAPDGAPDSADAEIEVLEQVEVPGAVASPDVRSTPTAEPSAAAGAPEDMPGWAAGRSTPEPAKSESPPPKARPEPSEPGAAPRSDPVRRPRSRAAVLGWIAIVIGIALVAAAGWLLIR
ncbi:serine/threonine-protein kinase [Solicola gregarius]|uniref:non-specific serine/threonine protein kinase n=1 Tax=Solicola gregarius TaxID=2908642 RepID=A0AA46TF82_9ACTN|nr:serine/threonine-protein kinase [Solicola gregarius]UYM03996.1 protein kinase [Solicola gregarius]